MDTPGNPRTPTGRRHGLLAAAAFVAVTLDSSRLSALLDRDGPHPAIATTSSVLAAAMGASLLTMALSGQFGLHYFRAVERVFYALMTTWLVAVAMLLVARSPASVPVSDIVPGAPAGHAQEGRR